MGASGEADAAELAPIVVAPGEEDEKEKGGEKKVGNRGQSNGNKEGKGRGKKGENAEGKIGQTTNGKEQGKNKAEEGNERGEHDGVSYIQKVFSTDADAAAPAPAVIVPGEADTAAPDIAPAPEEDGEEGEEGEEG